MNHFGGCLGIYCGRTFINQTLGECGACFRGSRSNYQQICVPCHEDLPFYDWLYLSFMVLVYVTIQCYFIDKCILSNKFNYLTCTLHLSTICEVLISASLSIVCFTSDWSFSLRTCGVKRFSDWYTLFYNPDSQHNCTHEAVYPLYSIVFVFYMISLCLVLTRHFYLRLILSVIYLITSSKLVKRICAFNERLHQENNVYVNIYYVLYSIPALIFTHAIFAGVIYYIFPYLTIIGSIISVAHHFSLHLDQSPRYLLMQTLQFRNALIILFHCGLHAFGIIALTQLRHYTDYALLLLVPFPSLFYIATSKFTDPVKL